MDFLKENGVDIDSALELFGDIKTYNETLVEFVNNIPLTLEKLRKCKEISDMKNYSIYAHSIKSDAKYFGFTHLADLALAHENESKNNNMYYIASNYDEFENEIIKDLNIARKYLGMDDADIKPSFNNVCDETILVVDDSDVIKKFIDITFKNKYNVVTAPEGATAINIILSNKYKIKAMLLDLNMPNFNGLQVLDFLKQNDLFKKISVTVITGVGSDDVLKKARSYDIKGVILKPFNETAIKRAVEGIN